MEYYRLRVAYLRDMRKDVFYPNEPHRTQETCALLEGGISELSYMLENDVQEVFGDE